jgi:hypothetical protein
MASISSIQAPSSKYTPPHLRSAGSTPQSSRIQTPHHSPVLKAKGFNSPRLSAKGNLLWSYIVDNDNPPQFPSETKGKPTPAHSISKTLDPKLPSEPEREIVIPEYNMTDSGHYPGYKVQTLIHLGATNVLHKPPSSDKPLPEPVMTYKPTFLSNSKHSSMSGSTISLKESISAQSYINKPDTDTLAHPQVLQKLQNFHITTQYKKLVQSIPQPLPHTTL